MLVCGRFGMRDVELKHEEGVEEVRQGRCTSCPRSMVFSIKEMVFFVAGREIAILELKKCCTGCTASKLPQYVPSFDIYSL